MESYKGIFGSGIYPLIPSASSMSLLPLYVACWDSYMGPTSNSESAPVPDAFFKITTWWYNTFIAVLQNYNVNGWKVA